MAWRQHFVDWLSAPVAYPQFILRVAAVDGYLPGAALSHGSHIGVSVATAAVTHRGSRITAGTLSPIDWSYTTGSCSLGVKSDTDLRKLLPRGCLVRVLCGAAGWDEDMFEPVFFGQLQNVSWEGEQWRVELRSIVGSLQSRFSQSTGNASLFYELGLSPQTSLDVAYSPTDVDLDVGSTTGLDKLTGGNYLVQVSPDSGDPFFLEATGKTAGTVTGCSAAGQIGTTAAAAGAGNTVVLCAFLEKNPVDAVRIVLVSTGGATNGEFDIGPTSWGLGLPSAYIDDVDCEATRLIVTPASGSELWDIYATEIQQDASEWIRTILQPAGMWLCERQGLITIRAIRPIEGYNHYQTESIQDADIVSISYQTWDPAQQAEYVSVAIVTATGSLASVSESLVTRPALESLYYTLPYCEENESAWRTQTIDRLSDRAKRIGEIVTIVCVGWRLATLTVGDEIVLYTRFIETWQGKLAWGGIVISVQPDWFGSTVEIKAIFNPERPELG